MSYNINLDDQSLFQYVKELEQVSQNVSNGRSANQEQDLIATEQSINNSILENFRDGSGSYNSFIWGILIVIVFGLLVLIVATGSCGRKMRTGTVDSLSYASEFGSGFDSGYMFVR